MTNKERLRADIAEIAPAFRRAVRARLEEWLATDDIEDHVGPLDMDDLLDNLVFDMHDPLEAERLTEENVIFFLEDRVTDE